jgi:uncharacterized coiled-coil protein SlyX
MGAVRKRLTRVEGQGREQRVVIESLKESVADLKADVGSLKTDMDRRIDHLDTKMSRQFMWLVSMQIMTLLAVVAALAAMLSAVGR